MPPKVPALSKYLDTLIPLAVGEACNEDVESAYYEPWNLALMHLCSLHMDNDFLLSTAPQACLTKEAIFDSDGVAIDLADELGECSTVTSLRTLP